MHANKLAEWVEMQDHVDFPLVRPRELRRDVIAFRDGWVDVENGTWYPADDAERAALCVDAGIECPAEPPLTLHYFDADGTACREQPTPLWEKFVKTQLYDREWEYGDDETDDEVNAFTMHVRGIRGPPVCARGL
eukprot:m.157162 g.157162  ORF g.157162 m.157162 type:complete len:135 (-) comp11727_c0_seq4:3335-3739(-)